MVKYIIIEVNYYLMVIFLWVEKKEKVKCIIMVYYIKKEHGTMMYFKDMLNNIIQVVKYNLMENLKMEDLMENVKNILIMDN